MFFRKIQSYIGAVVLAAFVGGCGGSTQGTGGITVEGRLLEIGGAPVSGALVTVVTTGDSALTDQNGGFVLQSDLPDINLLFESGETSASTVVSVTPTTRKVVATFRLDRERERVETENIELEEDSRDDDDPIEDDVDDDNGGDDDSIDDDSSDEDDSSGDDSSDDGENDGGDDDE
ncbi:MAG: hypothetical protein RL417_1852, partial [Pseudomonadota bacterium]